MKQYSRRELLLRIAASSADSALFSIGYMFINQLIGGTAVNILFFIFTALCGLLINLLPYNNSDKRKQSLTYSIVGLVLASLITAVSAIVNFRIFSVPILFVTLILVYYRANISYLSNVLYIFSIGEFNRSVGILFLINAAAALGNGIFGMISGELMRFSVFYIVLALYMLVEIKNFKYLNKSENIKKPVFETAALGFMLLFTVAMSIPKIFSVVTSPLSTAFRFIYGLILKGILFIVQPVALLLSSLIDRVPKPETEGWTKSSYNELTSNADKYNDTFFDGNSELLNTIVKALAFIVLLAICAYAVYLLFRFIDRYNRSKAVEDFEEEKEFVLGRRKSKGLGLIKKLGGAVKKAAGEIAFMFTADNADRLRSEYKDFIKKLYAKRIIEHYNYTALDIFDIALTRVPDQKAVLESITDMYEEVRYGVKYPQDNELKEFRRSIEEVSKVILQTE